MRVVSRLIALLFTWVRPILPSKRRNTDTLVIHQLLIGDGILIWPLLDQLKGEKHVAIACPIPLINLYRRFFPGYDYCAFSEKNPLTVVRLLWANRNCKRVICPIERRLHRYALAANPGEVIGYGSQTGQATRLNLKPLPTNQVTFSDMMANLIGHTGAKYQPVLTSQKSELRTCIFHIDAKNPNRRWTLSSWADLAGHLRALGFNIRWCGGTTSQHALQTLALEGEEVLQPPDLLLYLDEIQQSSLLVCPDTGIAHLAKLTTTPTIVIYGQGNPALHGNGLYWSSAKTLDLFRPNIRCRDKNTVMGYQLEWLTRCDKTPQECANPFCQNDITAEDVIKAAKKFLDIFSRHG